MRILYIDFANKDKEVLLLLNEDLIQKLKKYDKELIFLDRNFVRYIYKILVIKNKINISHIKKFILLPFEILLNIKNIYLNKSIYFKRIRNCIVDQIERETGNLSTLKTVKTFINKNFLDFIFKALRLTLLNFLIEYIIYRDKIDTIFIPQLDGFPYYSITNICIKKGIYIGSYIYDPYLIVTIRKDVSHERIALPHDLNNLALIDENQLNKTIEKSRTRFIKHQDSLSSTGNIINKNISQDVQFYKNIFKNNKKNGVVLLHMFVDQARVRLEHSWYDNYLDWLLETIHFCKMNNNINWFFKAHPFENLSPLSNKSQEYIYKNIVENNFVYIDSKKELLHGELSNFASFIVTCNGTCKIEYPAIFKIPVISCVGQYLCYDSFNQPFTAKNRNEYKDLILNSHNISADEDYFRKNKELLYFFKTKPETLDNANFKLFKHIDKKGMKVFRNY